MGQSIICQGNGNFKSHLKHAQHTTLSAELTVRRVDLELVELIAMDHSHLHHLSGTLQALSCPNKSKPA